MTTSSINTATSSNAPNNDVDPGDSGGGSGGRRGGNRGVGVPNVVCKSDSQDECWSSVGCTYINPFVHRVHIDNRIDMAKIYMLTVLLLPIRVMGCVLSLLSAWMFACIGLYGMTLDDLAEKPLSGWRKQVQRLAASAMRMVYASGSFHHITMKGERAPPKEAPILVVAPHSSYVDSIIVVAAGPPSIVAKRETSDIPFLGKIINFAQPIYVQREDPNSRQNTIREIVHRARSSEEWPQVVIFAEGTCTNRAALIKFKPGAFYPGVPVQPVLVRYPNKYDTFTWTWDGPGVLRLLWMTMSSFYSRCEIEYLPVYRPSEEEKADANLFARNVRDVMAKALVVPTSEYSFEDVIMMSRAKDLRVPFPGDIVEIERILYQLSLLDTQRDAELAADFLRISNADKLDVITFSELLQIDLKNTYLHHLFTILDHRCEGNVSLKSFLLCSLFCKHKNDEIIIFMRAITRIYAQSHRSITREEFARLLRHGGHLTPAKCDALFVKIDTTAKGVISFDEFEAYTKERVQYKHLYRKREHIRRTFNTK